MDDAAGGFDTRETSCVCLCSAVPDPFLAGARRSRCGRPEYRQVVQMKLAHHQRVDEVIEIA